jgi:hypothetical protein
LAFQDIPSSCFTGVSIVKGKKEVVSDYINNCLSPAEDIPTKEQIE